MQTEDAEEGPLLYELLHASQSQPQSGEAVEFPVYSDAHIVGEVAVGPFEFINACAFPGGPGNFTPGIVVYCSLPIYERSARPMSRTNTRLYHGGTFEDEVAAFVSLCTGIRTKAGAVDREYHAGSSRGRPIFVRRGPTPSSVPVRTPRMPWTAESCDITDKLRRIATLDRLSIDDAANLTKAARLYQQALWFSETDPETSWLLYVSAIEAVAKSQPSIVDAETAFSGLHRDLAELLRGSSDPHIFAKVATLFAPLLGSTRRFVSFILARLPDPPARRPPTGFQIRWDVTTMRRVALTIYDHRSRALHDGTPFPPPMCEIPFRESGWEAPTEIPFGLAMSTRGGTWLHEDTPIFLHMFDYLVRTVLLSWWDERAAAR